MSKQPSLTDQDRHQLAAAGISLAEAERQYEILTSPVRPARLNRPCTIGDGILQLDDARQQKCLDSWSKLVEHQRVAKLVPASGAATRMFRELTRLQAAASGESANSSADLEASADEFCRSIRRFAFASELEDRLRADGESLDRLVERRQLGPVLDAMLDGLGYAKLPKGLIPFHAYPEEVRTAAVEHLWEGAGYLGHPGAVCRLHYTVAHEHLERFTAHVDEGIVSTTGRLDAAFEVGFSTQGPATDTIAVRPDNELFRQNDGSLLLRPAGHGALLENLQSVDADVVFIKNIDNIAYRRLHPTSVQWKRILGGLFFQLESRIFELLDELESAEDAMGLVETARSFVLENLAISLPEGLSQADPKEQRSLLVRLLDRPLRVCGVVENTAEPGGGPFWLDAEDRSTSGQIVESAQVDLEDSSQAEVWRASTHFNPVDLVCGLRDRRGNVYQLQQFVDPSTTIVARKSHEGRSLKAMERPGLWNGSMAFWNTAFVEVPLATFTPVKTVFDLLRPEHQP